MRQISASSSALKSTGDRSSTQNGWAEQFADLTFQSGWRTEYNTVFELFPLFYLEKIGCWNWGFVAGKYQTYEPWNSTWEKYADDPTMDVDFTKWFHDLYRPNFRPYDPKEIELIRRFCDRADADFMRGRG